jgi:serine protease SohB
LRSTLRERYGNDVQMPLVAAERSLFGRRAQGVEAWPGLLGRGLDRQGLIDDLVSAIESRALWARFGL